MRLLPVLTGISLNRPWSKRLPLTDRLRQELGSVSRVRRLHSSPRSQVWHADLGGRPSVVKHVVNAPGAEHRFKREVAALQLAARASRAVAPVLLGHDDETRVLVLERLADQPPQQDWPISWARGLALLHATTTAADVGALPAWTGPGRSDIERFLSFASVLGATTSSEAGAELTAVVERLSSGGHDLLHGDPCPGNDLYGDDGVRFVDLEQAALGNGLVELAYLRIGFPTCWCVTAVPPAVLREAEHVYVATRLELSGGTRAQDATMSVDDSCIGWLIRGDALVEAARRDGSDHLAAALARDWSWGTVSARARLVHRLGVVATMDNAVGALAGRLHELALARWPGAGTIPRTSASKWRTT